MASCPLKVPSISRRSRSPWRDLACAATALALLLAAPPAPAAPPAAGASTTAPAAASASPEVADAMRRMRLSAAYLDLGDAERACAEYASILQAFPTWWMPLLGTVRCGLLAGHAPAELTARLDQALQYGAPPEKVGALRGQLLLITGQLDAACEALLPTAVAGGSVGLPLDEMLLCAWRRGRLGDVLALAARIERAGPPRLAVLRLAAEAALLLRDGPSTDRYLGALLERHPERTLLVRYLRDLRRRGRQGEYDRRLEQWHALVAPPP